MTLAERIFDKLDPYEVMDNGGTIEDVESILENEPLVIVEWLCSIIEEQD